MDDEIRSEASGLVLSSGSSNHTRSRREGGRRLVRIGRMMKLMMMVMMVILMLMMKGIDAVPLESHTFAAPFNDVQVDGKRYISP